MASYTKDGCDYLAKALNAATDSAHALKYSPPSLAASVNGSSTSAQFNGVEIANCSNGTDVGTKRKLWVPQFDLLSGNSCSFDSNRGILGQLTPQQCANNSSAKNIFTTRIQTKNKILLDGQSDTISGIVDSVIETEKTGPENSVFAVRMIKHDISRAPIKPEVVTYRVRQNKSRYFIVESTGLEREVTIANSYRPNFLVENFTAINPSLVFDTKVNLADDCKLANDLLALRSSGKYTPDLAGTGSAAGGRARSSK